MSIDIVEQFNVFAFPSLVRLVFACLCGGFFGILRERKRKPAGLKTHIMVCAASALVMILGEFLAITSGIQTDVARLGAQVISGVGFLGAGSIIKARAGVKGITTAASIWTVACIGLACGAGFYIGAAIVTALIIGVTYVANLIERKMHEETPHEKSNDADYDIVEIDE